MVKNRYWLIIPILLIMLTLPGGTTVQAQEDFPCGDTYVVRTGDNLREIAERCEVTVDEIVALNDFIEDPDLIYPGWVLDMPAGDEDEDDEEDVQIPVTGAATISNAYYVVKSGDSLPYISRRLDISEDALLTSNPQLSEEPNLYTGQILVLPDGFDDPAAAASPRVIEPGQFVTVVARGFDEDIEVIVAGGPLGTTERVLETLQVNSDGMIRTNVQVPMDAERGNRWTFIVRSTEDETNQARTNLVYVVDTTGPNDAIIYNVRLNDTLSSIAAKFGVTQEEILESNPQIEDPSVILIGQDILIPGPSMREN